MNKFKFLQDNTISREYNLYEEMIVQLMVYNSRNNISDINSFHRFLVSNRSNEIRILQVDCQLHSMLVHYRVCDYVYNQLELFNMEITYRDLNRLIDESNF